VGDALPADVGDADEVLAAFEAAGVGVAALAAKLQEDGEQSFNSSWNDLIGSIGKKQAALA
jgi:transaldolase